MLFNRSYGFPEYVFRANNLLIKNVKQNFLGFKNLVNQCHKGR